jgi:hypothetical protein
MARVPRSEADDTLSKVQSIRSRLLKLEVGIVFSIAESSKTVQLLMSPSQGWRVLLSNAMDLAGSLQQTGLLALMQCACFVVVMFACFISSALWKATSLFAATVTSASLIVCWRSNSAKWPPIKRSSLIWLSQPEALSTSNWKISRGRIAIASVQMRQLFSLGLCLFANKINLLEVQGGCPYCEPLSHWFYHK